tara:strand:- start:905 stop:1141 length:237 start_codon:yes stop_codon:yes gene_type:complete
MVILGKYQLKPNTIRGGISFPFLFMRGSERQSKLTFTILGPKKNKNRHPAGGYYIETDWGPKGPPKKYKKQKPPIVNT